MRVGEEQAPEEPSVIVPGVSRMVARFEAMISGSTRAEDAPGSQPRYVEQADVYAPPPPEADQGGGEPVEPVARASTGDPTRTIDVSAPDEGTGRPDRSPAPSRSPEDDEDQVEEIARNYREILHERDDEYDEYESPIARIDSHQGSERYGESAPPSTYDEEEEEEGRSSFRG